MKSSKYMRGITELVKEIKNECFNLRKKGTSL